MVQLLSGSVEADPVPRHRWQPTRPRSLWGSLGKNTGVGLGSTIPGIPQARTLEWVAISFSNAGK